MTITKNNFILIVLVVIPISMSFFSKLEVSNLFPFYKKIEELTLLLLIPIAVNGYFRIIKSKAWVYIYFFFFGYLVLGLISSFINKVGALQVIHQLIISIKYPYIIAVLFGLNNPIGFFYNYLKWAKVILVVSLVLIVWQFFGGNSYNDIFSSGLHGNTVILGDGIKGQRGAGVFTHPGQMAIFSGSLTIYFLSAYINRRNVKFSNATLWCLTSGATLILTFSRLEIFATVFALIVAFYLTAGGHSRYVMRILIVIFVTFIAILIYPVLDYIYTQSVPVDVLASFDPRIVFSVKGFEIASDHFPLGSGLGTYAGYVAAIYNSSVYMDYGFEIYYWYLEDTFMADTFWPHILGESGFFGLVFYCCSLVWIIYRATKVFSSDENQLMFARMTIASISLIIINSFASPDMTSVMSLAQCLIPISCLYFLEKGHA